MASDISTLLAKMPQLDTDDKGRQRGTLTGPAWSDATAIYQELLAGVEPAIIALIDTIHDKPDASDYRSRYLLHGLVLHVSRPDGAAAKAMLAKTIASQLAGEKPKAVQAVLIGQLQAFAGKDQAPALASLLGDHDLCEPAAQALLAIGEGAVEQFRAALPKASGPCRRTILQAMAVLRDRASLPAFRQALKDEDVDTRITAGWALAQLAEPTDIPALLAAADTPPHGHERIQQTKHCLLLAENLTATGKPADARKIYKHLADTRTDPSELYVRELCVAAGA